MVNEEFNKLVCLSYPKLLDDITNYFAAHNEHNMPVGYLVAEFIGKYYTIDALKQAINKLKTEKTGKNSFQDDDFEQRHRVTTKSNEIVYKSIYKGYICCPYCGYTRVPLTSDICTRCSAGLA